jgi:hypothetical protein
MLRAGCLWTRIKTSVRYAIGSMPFFWHEAITVYRTVKSWPDSSLPTKRKGPSESNPPQSSFGHVVVGGDGGKPKEPAELTEVLQEIPDGSCHSRARLEGVTMSSAPTNLLEMAAARLRQAPSSRPRDCSWACWWTSAGSTGWPRTPGDDHQRRSQVDEGTAMVREQRSTSSTAAASCPRMLIVIPLGPSATCAVTLGTRGQS